MKEATIIREQKPVPKRTYTPTHDLVAIHVPSQQDVTPSGLIMPDSAKTSLYALEALVIATGPECKQVKEGDTVIIHAMTALTECNHKGNVTLLLQEKHVMGVLTPE